jgi:hypothetical protein
MQKRERFNKNDISCSASTRQQETTEKQTNPEIKKLWNGANMFWISVQTDSSRRLRCAAV